MKANDLNRINLGVIYYRLNPHETKFPDLPNERNEHDWDILEATWNPVLKQWTLLIQAYVEPYEQAPETEEAEAEEETKEEADD